MTDILFEPGSVGGLQLRNRILRAGTSESMADPGSGEMTPPLATLYETLAAQQVGGIITGHLFVDERGKYARGQTGIHSDAMIPGLTDLARRTTSHGAMIFAQLAHAGSQSRVPGNTPLAPSPVPNPLTGADVAEASPGDIEQTIEAFAAAAKRAVLAGFSGVHIHGANGYLITEFTSPATNHRSDMWGGDDESRDAFPLAVISAVRDAVPDGYPVMMKMGMVDAVHEGLQLDESVRRAARLTRAGLDAIEVSCGLMEAPTDSANTYVAVGRLRAAQDLLIHRVLSAPRPEAYFRPWANALKAAVDLPVILVGGMRTTATMRDVLRFGDADFIALARPFIREPDLVAQIAAGREGRLDCTSCNLCLIHEGHHPLQCWRTPKRRLLEHAIYRLRGGFAAADVVPTRH